jgi:phosphomethylpyrimidine synthase
MKCHQYYLKNTNDTGEPSANEKDRMYTNAEHAREGTITPLMREVAKKEGIHPQELCTGISQGSMVIMQRGRHLTGIGKDLSTKVNVNLGTSTGKVSIEAELEKVRIAEQFGADTISDLSMVDGEPECTMCGEFCAIRIMREF